MKNFFFSVLLLTGVLFIGPSADAQDLPQYKKIISDMSGSRFQGRGYAKDGVRKAASYVKKQFQKAGVDEVILQPFTIDINTYGGRMCMSVDGRSLRAGIDFTMREYSPGVKGEYKVYHIDTLNFNMDNVMSDLRKPENEGCFVEYDFWYAYREHRKDFARLQKEDLPIAGLIQTWDAPLKFYKAYGEKVVSKPIVWTTREAIKGVKTVSFNIENRFLQSYATDNVIAKVSGRRHDSCYVFTAHYDHLGNIGSSVFCPGANDNASGTAAIITLAGCFAANKPEYDMYFIAFSAEEAGLRGSTFYAENPLVPLQDIRFLINIDMIGDDNPSLYAEFSDAGKAFIPAFESLNGKGSYFKSINIGELSENSDHYPFAVRGVPCVFFENKEGSAFKYYHTPMDDLKTVKYDSYIPLFNLVKDFVLSL